MFFWAPEINLGDQKNTLWGPKKHHAQIYPDQFKIVNSSGPEPKLVIISTRNDIRYQGGALRFRRQATNGTLSNHCNFPDSTTGNTVFTNKITADAFQTSSDERINVHYEEIPADESCDIVESVNPQQYTR